ncbi:hypothetical protein BkAM31D_01820 [Halalkalibacter krulwichiae]|uniref:Uncharacterized protein n=1 Tax=Halalkalibacter krulwichiae TaxID=199441 RepID=A0A1Y9TI72_9BACI|nr:hypothetical protein BkAM31D_01820 [Halalkalibacter krulwichiae]
MGLCLTLIAIGLTIGFLTYSYVGLLLGFIVSLILSLIINQFLYKRHGHNSPSDLYSDRFPS